MKSEKIKRTFLITPKHLKALDKVHNELKINKSNQIELALNYFFENLDKIIKI